MDMLDLIRQKLRIDYVKLPRTFSAALIKTRYVLLSVIVLVALAIGLPLFTGDIIRKEAFQLSCQACPARILFSFFPGGWNLYLDYNSWIFGLITTIAVLMFGIFILGIFVRRSWCRICPNGAILGLFNVGCLVEKEKDLQKCTKCGICYAVCPYDNKDVYLIKNKKVVNSNNCMFCMECVHKCPEDDCLKGKFMGKTIFI